MTNLRATAGSLIVGGFPSPTVDPETRRALQAGERGGVILFKRNLPSVEAARALCHEVRDATPGEASPLIGVDQEGGRVARLPSPFLRLPPMRALAAIGDDELVLRAARLLGSELAALGFNLDFSPVLDVDSNPRNPVIGDRAFASDPGRVADLGVRFGLELQAAGILACGKHFPGHGDTSEDSHFHLPRVSAPRKRLEAVELPPFVRACQQGIATLMSAHVIYDGLDPETPATLSRRIATELLRDELGFRGLLFSDDLEMRALSDRMSIEESAVLAIRAGCDALLICENIALAEQALAALVREAEVDEGFRERLEEAAERVRTARLSAPIRPNPGDPEAVEALEHEIGQRLD